MLIVVMVFSVVWVPVNSFATDEATISNDSKSSSVEQSNTEDADGSASTKETNATTETTAQSKKQVSETLQSNNQDEDQAQGQSQEKMNSWRFSEGQLNTVPQKNSSSATLFSSGSSRSNKTPIAQGIDVSAWQGTIDWDAVKNSGEVDFVIIRCGWGDNDSSQNDSQWLRNASECKRLGIPFGVYIYSYAYSTSSAISEADHVLAQLNAAGLSPSDVFLPIYLDLEQTSKRTYGPCGINNYNNEVLLSNDDLANMAQAFCDRVSNAGYISGVYANLNWWNNYLTDSVFNNYDRWVAQYNDSCWYDGSYSLWQYSSTGDVDGIAGCVDVNYAYSLAFEEQYSAVYDYEYYKANNPDVDSAYSGNRYKILKHFINYGMKEGRQGCENFDVTSYYNEYPDLRVAYGSDLKKYYEHYIKYGQNEGRHSTGCSSLKGYVTTYNGVDYSAVYDGIYYAKNNSDVTNWASFGPGLVSDAKLIQHFVNYGMNEGRQGCEKFDVMSYYNEYSDLRATYGNDLKKYYEHYINYGQKEGRNTTGCTSRKGYIATYNGVNYSAVYDGAYYADNNSDVTDWASRDSGSVDEVKLIQHFVNYGMKEGRQGCENFDVTSYYNEYPDLRAAYGNDLKKYYEHYIKYGQNEGRHSTGCTEMRY